MSASTTPHTGTRLAHWVAGVSGAVFGLAVARFLFELDPIGLSPFSAWPAALLLAGLGLVGALGLSLYAGRLDDATWPSARWVPIALALPLISLLSTDINPLRSITLLVGASVLFVLMLMAPAEPRSAREPNTSPLPSRTMQPLLSLALFLFLLCLYLRTLAPAVGQADTFEFQVGVARLGIAHGSGYPLLMLIGRLFTLLPIGGTLAFRANLTSAFFGALAGVGVERIARRLGASPLVGLLAGLAFGVSPTLWSRAVEIEAYTLNAAFVAAIVYLALSLCGFDTGVGRAITYPFPVTDTQLRLCLLAFVFGLSLTNHLTTLLLAPAGLFAVALGTMTRRQRQATNRNRSAASVLRQSSVVAFAFLCGLSVYLYLPLRWPAVNHGEALSIAGFLNIITGNEARGAFQWRLPFQDLGRYPIVWSKIAGEYGRAGLGLALLGFIATLRAARPITLAPQLSARPPSSVWTLGQLSLHRYGVPITLVLTYLGYLYFALAFNVPDPDFSAFFIPLHLITAVLIGLGVQGLLNWLHGRSRQAGTLALAALVCSAFCLLSLTSIWRTFPLVDHSGNWASQKAGDLMLSQPLANHAAILADSEKIAPLDYLQIAESRRPDLDIIVLPDEASYRSALAERLAVGQVVYLGRYLPGLGSAYSLRSVGPLAEVSPAPFSSTNLALHPPLAQPPVTGIELVGYAPSSGGSTLSASAPGALGITLVWHVQTTPTDNLLVNLRLVNDREQAAWQAAGSVPVNGLYPTNAWRVGEFISDFYSLPIAPSLAPGAYQLQAALLTPFAPAPDSAWTSVAPVTILSPTQPPTPPHLLRDQIGPRWLLGYDIPEAVAPGSSFAVTLYWLRTAQSAAVPGPSTQFVKGETKDIVDWPVGSVVPVVYRLTAPPSGLALNLSVDADGPAVCGWLAMSAHECPLPSILLAGQAAAAGAVNYDNQLLLNLARLDTPAVAPGGTVAVNLEWQALRAIAVDYTVFVHLVGPDGLVHGQVDRWPVSGTRATSSWIPGERIGDAYLIQLPVDAPPGAYQVEIGMYLLSTGERLPILNADGMPVDDRLLLRGLDLQSR